MKTIVEDKGAQYSQVSVATVIAELGSHATGLTNPEAQRRLARRESRRIATKNSALDTLALPVTVRVRRSDRIRTVPFQEVVVGDIVLLQPGDIVPADMRVLDTGGCTVDASALFGGTADARVYAHALDSAAASSERHNLLYAGTLVTSGNASGVVFAVEKQTELGSLVQSELSPSTRPVLWQTTARIWHISLLLTALVASLVSWLAAPAFNVPQSTILLAIGALLLAAILPVLPLATGLSTWWLRWQLRSTKTVVKNFNALQQLTGIDTLLLDTEAFGSPALHPARLVVGRNFYHFETYNSVRTIKNTANKRLTKAETAQLTLVGEAAVLSYGPTETYATHPILAAMHELAGSIGITAKGLSTPHQHQRSFAHDAHRQLGSATYAYGTDVVLFTHGTPTAVLERCTKIWDHGHVRPLSPGDRQHHVQQQIVAATEGRRSIALAYRILPKKTALATMDAAMAEVSLTYLGIVELESAAQAQVTQTLQALQPSGIKVSLVSAHSHPYAITSQRLTTMSDERLLARLNSGTATFAGLSSHDLLRLVSITQAQGRSVGIAGQALAYLPAMRQASIMLTSPHAPVAMRRSAAIILSEPATIAPLRHLARRTVQAAEQLTLRLIVIHTSIALVTLLSLAAALLYHVPPALTPIGVLIIGVMLTIFVILFSRRKTRTKHTSYAIRHAFEHAALIGVLSYAAFLTFFWIHSLSPAYLSPTSSLAYGATSVTILSLMLGVLVALMTNL